MKTHIITTTGKGKEVEMPSWFSDTIREDLAQKFFEISKEQQPYAPGLESGKKASASGIVKHRRHIWKTAYGHGISRVPRKIFWRRGTQFHWIGATVPGTRKGRMAHPPRVEHFTAVKKMNKKEQEMALKSAFASTASAEWMRKRYSSIPSDFKMEIPMVVDEAVLKLNTKEFVKFLQNHFKGIENIVFRERKQRAGRGKIRGRKYSARAGLLLITADDENKKFSGITVRKLRDLEINDLFPLGRLTMYTEKAIKELNKIGESK